MKNSFFNIVLSKIEDWELPNPIVLTKIALAADWSIAARFFLFSGAVGAFSSYRDEMLDDTIVGALKKCSHLEYSPNHQNDEIHEVLNLFLFLLSDAAVRRGLLNEARDELLVGLDYKANALKISYAIIKEIDVKNKTKPASEWIELFDKFSQSRLKENFSVFENNIMASVNNMSLADIETWVDPWIESLGSEKHLHLNSEEVSDSKLVQDTEILDKAKSETDCSAAQYPKFYFELLENPRINIDVQKFHCLLEESLSLSYHEKITVVNSFPTLSQFQVDELIKVFEDEKKKFIDITEDHPKDVKELALLRKNELERHRKNKELLDKTQRDAEKLRTTVQRALGRHFYEKIEKLGSVL